MPITASHGRPKTGDGACRLVMMVESDVLVVDELGGGVVVDELAELGGGVVVDELGGGVVVDAPLGAAATEKLRVGAALPPTVQTSDQVPTVSGVIDPLIVWRPVESVLPNGVVPLFVPFCVPCTATGEFAGPITVTVKPSPTWKG